MVIFALTVFFMFPARRFFSENLTKNELIISRNLNEINSQEFTTELFRAFFNNLINEFEGQSTLKISYIKNFIIENNNLLSENNYRRDWMIVFETLFSALYHNKSYNSIVDNYREYESMLIENKILNDKIEFFYVASRMEIFRNIQHEGIFRELLSKLNELEKSTLDEDYKTHVQIVKAEVYYKLWEIEKFNIQSTNYSESLKLLNIEMLKNNYDALIIKRNVYEKIHDLLSERNPRTGFFTFKYNTININGVSFQRDEIKHELNSINKILKDNF
jgi:hypothetical protein